MRHRFTERAQQEYAETPQEIRRAFNRRLAFLLQNLLHPSLHAKKYNGANDI